MQIDQVATLVAGCIMPCGMAQFQTWATCHRSAWFLSLAGLTFVKLCSYRCQLQVLHAVVCVYGSSCSGATSSHVAGSSSGHYCSLPSVGVSRLTPPT